MRTFDLILAMGLVLEIRAEPTWRVDSLVVTPPLTFWQHVWNTTTNLYASAAEPLPLFETHVDAITNYVWSTKSAAWPLHGLTSIAAEYSGNAGKNGTLIAPRLVVAAAHAFWKPGSASYYADAGEGVGYWRFVERDGTVHHAYAKASRLWTNSGVATDVRIFVLKNELAEIECATIPPTNLLSAMATAKFPQMTGDAGKKLVWQDATASGSSIHSTIVGVPYPEWTEGIRPGDSGSGCFFAVGTNLMIVKQHYFSSFGEALGQDNFLETCEWLCTNNGYTYTAPVVQKLPGDE